MCSQPNGKPVSVRAHMCKHAHLCVFIERRSLVGSEADRSSYLQDHVGNHIFNILYTKQNTQVINIFFPNIRAHGTMVVTVQ